MQTVQHGSLQLRDLVCPVVAPPSQSPQLLECALYPCAAVPLQFLVQAPLYPCSNTQTDTDWCNLYPSRTRISHTVHPCAGFGSLLFHSFLRYRWTDIQTHKSISVDLLARAVFVSQTKLFGFLFLLSTTTLFCLQGDDIFIAEPNIFLQSLFFNHKHFFAFYTTKTGYK